MNTNEKSGAETTRARERRQKKYKKYLKQYYLSIFWIVISIISIVVSFICGFRFIFMDDSSLVLCLTMLICFIIVLISFPKGWNVYGDYYAEIAEWNKKNKNSTDKND